MRYQPIYDIAELCAKRKLTSVVLCPGSRCAPLTLAFTRHPDLSTRTFSDERSAAFIGLGIAQHTKKPSILVCTSGTAVYNFAPAVAEAFFAQVPLLIFTADRPSEWIAQQDGQTIYQDGIFGKHVKKSFQLPQEYEHADSQWEINRIVNEAISLAQAEPRGPVHINAPFREPLYPSPDQNIEYSENVRIMEELVTPSSIDDQIKINLLEEWTNYHNILIVAGQHTTDSVLHQHIETFSAKHEVPVVGELLSNLHPIESVIRYSEVFLAQAPDSIKKTLKPDLLITFGNSVISKNVKIFLRNYRPDAHWHIQHAGAVSDSFQSITQVIRTTPQVFFDFMSSVDALKNFESQKQSNYKKLWEVEERRVKRATQSFFPQEELGELELVHEVMKHLPQNCQLHVANSMSVRYANIIGLASQQQIEVFSNRGTSGIDGCTSTTVGHALVSDKPQFLITGDLAFFYDRNAFWHNYALPNLRIVLLNNHGGIIFKMIDGPKELPESDEYFVTKQKLTAAKLCEEFDFDHLKLDHKRKLKNILKDFFDFDGRTKVLELESSIDLNTELFENFKSLIKKSYEQ